MSVGPWYTDIFGIERGRAALGGEPPPGIDPLSVDIFTSKDFYQDSEYWTDPRYYRCSGPAELEFYSEVGGKQGKDAPWGHCDRGVPASAIVSPYPFKTAKEHFEALRAEAAARGGPTKHTTATLPAWDGIYSPQHEENVPLSSSSAPGAPGESVSLPLKYPNWMWWNGGSAAEIVKLLTPEYQKRMVQYIYHGVVNGAHNAPAQYCMPKGFMSGFGGPGWSRYMIVKPEVITVLGSAATITRTMLTDREFSFAGDVPGLGPGVPKWNGETIGFWDDDAYIAWTSNVQGWISYLGMAFEYSNQMQTIEIFTPDQREDGFWLKQETIFYDPEAFVDPVRLIVGWRKLHDLNGGAPHSSHYCLRTIYPINGRPAQVVIGTKFEYTQPDYFDRPWARILEEYFEQDMNPPKDEQESIFGQFE